MSHSEELSHCLLLLQTQIHNSFFDHNSFALSNRNGTTIQKAPRSESDCHWVRCARLNPLQPAEEDDELATPTQVNPSQAYYGDEETGIDGVEEAYDSGSGSIAQLSKSFVRYALACEYARIPIKRQEVAQKGVNERLAIPIDLLLTTLVLGTHSRQFKAVFDAANSQLLDTFGMEMVELPNKEKTTIRQKRGRSWDLDCHTDETADLIQRRWPRNHKTKAVTSGC